MQLLLLLWKSWKTFIRSQGWLAAQCIISVICWLIAGYILHTITSKPELIQMVEMMTGKGGMGDSSVSNSKIEEYPVSLQGLKHNCADDSDCINMIKAVCPRIHKNENKTCEKATDLKASGVVSVRKIDESSVDFEFSSHSTCTYKIESASDHFNDKLNEASSCTEGPVFRLLVQQLWKEKGNLTVISLQRKRRGPSEYESSLITTLLIHAYLVPIFVFTLQAAMEVTQESASLIKDYLLSMGMSRTFYFLHHFIFHFLKSWISVIVLTLITGGMFESVGLAFYFFLLFTFALASWISLSLLIGSLFKKPGNSVLLMFILWVAMFVMYYFVYISRTQYISILYSLNPLYAIYLIIDARKEADFRGIDEARLFTEVQYAITQEYYIFIQIFEAVFLFFLAVFVDWLNNSCVNPITSLILQLKKKKTDIGEESKRLFDNLEKSDDSTPADLVIEGVHKVYSTGFHAVRGVHMRMHKGQVTALLGHNGAGKSTTFSMISGMTVPTKGRIEIMGSDQVSDRQKMIGFCPQYNAIFPLLTVDEHIEFFARLKGSQSWRETGNRVLTALGMANAGKVRAALLSGGMKRKLCIAVAMAADPPIVLLDEPTAGLDPGARRDFEKLLLEWKKEHTILLTTHYTDEAELLSDRIFIMAKGKVFCSGSPQFLRKKFDSGYVLSIAVKDDAETEKTSAEIMNIVKEFVPEVSPYKNRGKQFELKLSTDDTKRFSEMFRKIEADGPTLGMQSYGLSQNQLEQVFLKVGELTGEVDRNAEVEAALKELIQENEKRAKGPMKVMKQFGNTLLKRFMFDLGHIPSLIILLVLIFPLTYILFGRAETLMVQSEEEAAADYLLIHDRYRIGVHSELFDNNADIEKIAKRFGKYLTIERFSNHPMNWYYDNAQSRPPILGAIRNAGNDWGIYIPSHHMIYLPTLETIVAMLNNKDLTKVRYKVNKVPLFRNRARDDEGDKQKSNILFIAVVFPFLMCIVTPLMIIRPSSFLIIERISNFGHQERLTGVNRAVFLSSSFLYDFLIFLPHFIVFFSACFASSSKVAKKMAVQLIYLPLLAFLSGELIILIMYRIFATRAKGFTLIILFLIALGMFGSVVPYLVIFALGLDDHTNNAETYPHLLISPWFTALVWSEGSEDSMTTMIKRMRGYTKESRAHITGPIYIILHFFILIAVFVLVEMKIWRLFKRINVWRLFRRRNDDVAPAAIGGPEDSLVLRVNNLQKWYGSGKIMKRAVNGINFGVRAHECFGVLGINGAGKTSTFEMLTGNTMPNGGSATVGGVDCSKAPTIGYCPQADALIEDLTGRQSLVVLAALHGYENPRKVANIVITCVGMKDHADKRTGTYSGGQRRKISVAASLLAQNSLIILDEPTAGIDPIARRDIWSVICALRESTNTAIVLTSHSMDEVEALVSNLIIMRDGSIVVEGSPQLIKNQFGGHYKFNLVIENGTNVEEVTSQVLSVFPTASLYDSASLRNIKYRIPRFPSDVFSALFEKASGIADQLKASDFCFTQATLEDAFMLAATAILPAEAAVSTPQEVTASTGSATDPSPTSSSVPEKIAVE